MLAAHSVAHTNTGLHSTEATLCATPGVVLDTHITLPRALARTHLAPRHATHSLAVQRLLGCLVYAGRLEHSPYTDLVSAADPAGLEAAFAAAFAAKLKMGARAPLAVAASIGGGGALARIEKGRKLMRERRSEWSQADELPVRTCLHRFDVSGSLTHS